MAMKTYDLLQEQQTAPRSQPGSPPGAGIARFMALRGLRTFEAEGIRWGIHRAGIYQSLPFQLQIDLTAGEGERLLRHHRLPVLRVPSRHMRGAVSGFYVCRPQGYDLSRVDRRQRSHVRKGLECCEIRRIAPEELRRDGLLLNRETMQRQRRFNAEFGEPKRWNVFVDALARCPEFGVIGGYVDGQLACYLITCQEDGWLHLLYKNSRTEALSRYVNHALDYWVLRDAGQNSAIEAVGNYFFTHPAQSGLNQYKRQMGYRLVEHNLCTFMHPRLAPLLVNRAALGAVHLARSASPRSELIDSVARLLESAAATRPAEAEARERLLCQHAESGGQQEPEQLAARSSTPANHKTFDRNRGSGLPERMPRSAVS